MRKWSSTIVAAGLLTAALLAGTLGTPRADAGSAYVVTAAGDIATSGSGDTQTSDRILALHPDLELTLGDNAYDAGTPEQYQAYYDPTWGRFKTTTQPAPGNHDWYTSGASGYKAYFGQATTYHAFDAGGWHFIQLDSELDPTQQAAFLRANAGTGCQIAYWHKPRFSSGTEHGGDPYFQPMWQAAQDTGVELVLNGHEHNYERFRRMNGTREVVAGTGGATTYPFGTPVPKSQVRIAGTWGVLRLSLFTDHYVGRFVRASDGVVLDHFRGACH